MESDYHSLSALSVIEIKEALNKKQIDNVGIYDKETLINLASGKQSSIDLKAQIPSSYLQLFEVGTWTVMWTSWKTSERKKQKTVLRDIYSSWRNEKP